MPWLGEPRGRRCPVISAREIASAEEKPAGCIQPDEGAGTRARAARLLFQPGGRPRRSLDPGALTIETGPTASDPMATPLSLFTDRRPLHQIGGLRAYLRQVSWSLWWHLASRRRMPAPAEGRKDEDRGDLGRHRATKPPAPLGSR